MNEQPPSKQPSSEQKVCAQCSRPLVAGLDFETVCVHCEYERLRNRPSNPSVDEALQWALEHSNEHGTYRKLANEIVRLRAMLTYHDSALLCLGGVTYHALRGDIDGVRRVLGDLEAKLDAGTPDETPDVAQLNRDMCAKDGHAWNRIATVKCWRCNAERLPDVASEPHVHSFTMGVCSCGERSGGYLTY